MQIQTPGATAKSVWRRLEDYTLQIYSEDDNNDVYVTVCNITGRGILVSIGCNKANANYDIYVKITIDGGTPVEKIWIKAGAHPYGRSQTLMAGFDTSCKVEMKGSDIITARFLAVTLEE
jgi:hypothetical protein